jgi:hypothetical protein
MFSVIGGLCVRRHRHVAVGALVLFVIGTFVGSGVFMHFKESRIADRNDRVAARGR